MAFPIMLLLRELEIPSTITASLKCEYSYFPFCSFFYGEEPSTEYFVNKDYKNKKHYLQGFSQNPEIEFILDTICDEAIVYDERNFWAYFSFMQHDDVDEETYDKVQKRYKEIYNLFGFNQDILAWHLFRKFLSDGILSFEIVFDKKGKKKFICFYSYSFTLWDKTKKIRKILIKDGKTIDVELYGFADTNNQKESEKLEDLD